MDTNKAITTLIESAKSGGKNFSSMDASDNLVKSLNSYAKSKSDNVASQCGVSIAHLEHSIMRLLDEINMQARVIENNERTIKVCQETIEIYKETINSIA